MKMKKQKNKLTKKQKNKFTIFETNKEWHPFGDVTLY